MEYVDEAKVVSKSDDLLVEYDRESELFGAGADFGREEGITIGREEGITIGREEKEKELVLSLLDNGASLDLVSKSTGLSIEKIKKMKKEIDEQ